LEAAKASLKKSLAFYKLHCEYKNATTNAQIESRLRTKLNLVSQKSKKEINNGISTSNSSSSSNSRDQQRTNIPIISAILENNSHQMVPVEETESSDRHISDERRRLKRSELRKKSLEIVEIVNDAVSTRYSAKGDEVKREDEVVKPSMLVKVSAIGNDREVDKENEIIREELLVGESESSGEDSRSKDKAKENLSENEEEEVTDGNETLIERHESMKKIVDELKDNVGGKNVNTSEVGASESSENEDFEIFKKQIIDLSGQK
jgi:hypothetical protein